MKLFRLFLGIFTFVILTLVTQIGGIVFLISIACYRCIIKKVTKQRLLIKLSLFTVLYLLGTFTVVPLIAKPLGRVPLPVFGNQYLKPLNLITCLLNRHYVRPQLKDQMVATSQRMQERYPGTVISYLDANFPFYDGFPLLPHLSHNDGKKVDLAFFYKDGSGTPLHHKAPSFIGYGIFEEPMTQEQNMPSICKEKGYWQYSLLGKVVPQYGKERFQFDAQRTQYLIQLIVADHNTQKLFIEPHLKSRMNLQSSKVRFHGCQAVRHDDHIHLQIK